MDNIENHYSVQDIEQRILSALRKAGLNPDQRLTPEELGALDHFHTGGYISSLVLQELAQVQADHRVLDIGAGLAGAARMLAASTGCVVDCIELSQDYCVGAELLNRLTGLEDLVNVFKGSALEMSFPDSTFHVAWMQNVGMNIEDKQKLYAEVHRVLTPGGCLAFQEMTAGHQDASYYPLPWATDPSDNFLISAEDMQSMLEECGFEVEYFEDVSDAQLNPAQKELSQKLPEVDLSLSTYVDDLALKAENAQRSLKEGQVRFYRGIFRTANKNN